MRTMLGEGLAIALLPVLVGWAPLPAQAPPTWTQVASTGPAVRQEHALAYDSLRGKTVLFGGHSNGGGRLGDTWEWDGSTWTQVSTTGPAARRGHEMAYDSLRGVTVLFGGYSPGSWLGDTWEWNGSNWTQAASTGPGGRYEHAMVYDSLRGVTVLFGGFDNADLGDTWQWDGGNWTQVSATGPAARHWHTMAYDSLRDRTVLFGGQPDKSSNLGDTWEWDGGNWTQVSTTGPSARRWQAMAYDSLLGRVVLFGGFNDVTFFNDTWEWNGSNWMQVASAGPSARYLHTMAYDSQRGRTVLFGGFDNSFLGDTWEWDSNYVSTAATFGSGCGNPALDLAPILSARPTIGTTAQAALANIPSAVAFVALGWSRTAFGVSPLPLSLAGFGMPGCDLLQSAEAAAEPVTFTGTGSATFSLPLPNMTGLVGAQLYLQGWALAPGVNAGNTIVSNGVEWGIGNA